MRKVEASEILDLTSYEKIRAEFLERTIALKRPRRISVDHPNYTGKTRIDGEARASLMADLLD